MPETVITVQGQHSASYAAELAIVSVGVNLDGADRETVFAEATVSAASVRAAIETLHDANSGPVQRFSANAIRLWSQRPWNDSGEQRDLVHYAALDFSVRFNDFTALNAFIESVAAIKGVTITNITWELTDATTASATAEARSRAVKDAMAKATVFAQSIGLGSVTATAIADPGMLGENVSSQSFAPGTARMMKASFDGEGSAPLSLKAEPIEISAAVDARFVAR